MQNKEFKLGTIVCTRGIAEYTKKDEFRVGIEKCLTRHATGDWGNICDEDKKTNEEGLKYGYRLMSVYNVYGTVIWIITEADRSVTTVLLPEEY